MPSPTERAATIWTTLGGQVGNTFTFALNGVDFAVTLLAVHENWALGRDPYPSQGCLATAIRASTGKGGNKVFLPLPDEHPSGYIFNFFNPPDGVVIGYDTEGVPIEGFGGAHALDAAKLMVYEAVTAEARNQGWTG